MTERSKRRFRSAPPKSAQSHPPVMVKLESDGSPSDRFIPPKRNETSPASVSLTSAGHVANGPSLNGTNGGSSSDRHNGVKKVPLLPPNRPPNGPPNRPPNGPPNRPPNATPNRPPNGPSHCPATKSISSDSNTSNKSDLCGSLNRPVELPNGDMEELDEQRHQPNVSSEVKRPLLPPTSKAPAEKSKPLTLPPGPPRSPSHPGNEEELKDGSNVGQSVSKLDGQQPNIHEPPSENANSARTGPPNPSLSPSVMDTPPTSGSQSLEDAKQIARMKLSRAIEQAKATSSASSDGKNDSLPPKSHSLSPPPLQAAGTDNRKSRTSSMTSPLSPSSTPSPTVLVSFGLASQAKRRKDKQQGGQILEVDDNEPDDSGPHSGECRPGKFAGTNKSIVSAATKRFQKHSEQHERQNVTKKKAQGVSDMDRVQATHSPPQRNRTEREKENLSCEGDEVFSSQEQQEPGTTPLTRSKKQLPHCNLKSESQAVSDSTRKGVLSKRGVLRADESWIKSRNDTETEDVEDSRSHQILNTSSPTPPSQPPTSIPPRTFNATPQHALPGTTIPTKPAAIKIQSYGQTTAHHLASQLEENIRSRVRVSPISGSKNSDFTRENRTKSGMSRSASDDSLQGTLQRRDILYSSQRQPLSTRNLPPKRPTVPPRIRSADPHSDRGNGRPSSVFVSQDGHPSQRPWDGGPENDLTLSCTVPSVTTREKSPKSKIKKTESNPLTKKVSFFSRNKLKTRESDLARIPASPLEEEQCNDDSSSEDERGGTIKFKPKLRPVSVRRPSAGEDDFDLSYPHLFERVFVVGLKYDSTSKKLVTEVTYTFPPRPQSETARDETMEAIPQFCFPDIDKLKPTKEYKSETFSFVLTNIEGQRRFGYCRRLLPSGKGARLPEVTCLVSPLGCFSLYETILNHIEERRQYSTTAVFTFLKAIQSNPFPKPGRSVEVKAFPPKGGDLETVTFTRPLDSRLEHVDFSLLFSTLSPRKIIQLFSSMLMERRIILCANNLSLLTGCAHALLALLYPFEWQHVFIPILPGALIDFCCSPLPYMIGMNPSLIRSLDDMDTMEEALVVDLDKKKFVKKIGDESSILPSKLFNFLEHALGSSEIAKRTTPYRADEIVINAFMIFFVYLYGDYKDYMQQQPDGSMEFQKKEYEQKFSSKSIKRFLEAFHMTQMFENFIEQRENPLKAETTAKSTFERQSIRDMKERCIDVELCSSKSKISRWRLKKRN